MSINENTVLPLRKKIIGKYFEINKVEKKIKRSEKSLSKNELEEKNLAFYEEYIKMLEANTVLNNYLTQILEKKTKCKQELVEEERKNFEKLRNSMNNDPYLNRKRKRRHRKQIPIYNYKCDFPNCSKQYTTWGSLKQHIKLKHSKLESLNKK